MKNLKSIVRLLSAYDEGERFFIDCDLDGSLQAANLKGVTFKECFLLCDFRGANLEGARFEKCNLKTCSFREANLTDTVITKCSVEGIDFIDANVGRLKFNCNYYMGSTMNQNDLQGFCSNPLLRQSQD